jgi:two-component system nitrogen regulation sensor histidine kinase GlnL
MNAKLHNDISLSKQILDNLSTAVLLLNNQLHLEYINPAGEELLAISAKRLSGISLEELLPNTHLIKLIRKTLSSNHPCTDREMTLSLPDLRTITIDCTLTPYIMPDKQTAIMIEMMSMDRHLRIARDEQLHTQSQATKELLRGLAHEIKNPLGGLRGSAQLLERELASEELKEYTQVIINEADRLRNLVDRMLAPHNPPQMQMINIHQLTERVLNLVSMEVPAGIKLLRDYDPSLPELCADPDQLIQAILNITRNAAQALGEHGTITLRSRPLRHFTIGQQLHKLVLNLQIIDDGPGIAPELLEAIFYPLVSGRADGSGLGLTIAQTLINQHNGLIECSSEPGCTIFSILIPLETHGEENTP